MRTWPDPAADALARLTTDPALRARLGRAGRALIQREFTDARTAAKMMALLYARLLDARPARGAVQATARL